MRLGPAVVLWIFSVCQISVAFAQPASTLEEKLLTHRPSRLAKKASNSGNALRGAVLFHSRRVGCSVCHSVTGSSAANPLGPDLANWDKSVDDTYLVQSVLRPSDHVEPQYRTSRFLLTSGKSITGIVVDSGSDSWTVRTGAGEKEVVRLSSDDVIAKESSEVSLMPSGQVQALSSVEEFYDLIAYLAAIRDGGPRAARRLQPAREQLQLSLPKYESRIDHAGLISSLDKESLARGEAIYERLCVNCHGTREREGSLPTALRFASGKFKNGSDPYSIYQTLTHGYGLMLPQTWMVPQQKYDVVHYLRKSFLADRDDVTAIDSAYLKGLPKGDTFGPPPTKHEPWKLMDYGSMMMTTIEVGNNGSNIAQKGIAVRLDPGPGGIAAGSHWILYEHDTLRCAGIWSGDKFIDWRGIQFNGRHGVHPRVVGDVWLENPTGPGWGNPETGELEDTSRVVGRDGRRYGPLPADWAKFQGIRRSGNDIALDYNVGGIAISEQPSLVQANQAESPMVVRNFRIQPHAQPLRLLAATVPASASVQIGDGSVLVFEPQTAEGGSSQTLSLDAASSNATHWVRENDQLILEIAASDSVATVHLAVRKFDSSSAQTSSAESQRAEAFSDLAASNLLSGSAEPERLWPVTVTTKPSTWFEGDCWAVDDLTVPKGNPWMARVRVTGLAFDNKGSSMVVATWDGDVWRVDGLESLDHESRTLRWQRIASGLFQPLGIAVLSDGLMVTCRDQLVKLRDSNNDGEMDLYEAFNSDHQVTEHFHEFAMGLARDDAGNWYYAKSARHALPAVVPHHGTLLRVTPDGQRTEIIATGFRAANGVCLNPDGSFIVTDQEGHWNPKNRINWVREGGFYGNMFGYHDVTDASDSAMEQPLCWITNDFDRSPAELLWVPDNAWGPLSGSLVNLSYGYGRLHVVPHEFVGDQPQGGMCKLPIPDLPTGIIRGSFSPRDHQLYVGGMFAWASSRQESEGGLYRVRMLDRPTLPTGYHVGEGYLELTLSSEIDPKRAAETERYTVTAWDLRRTANYGSKHYNQREWSVEEASVSANGKTLRLKIPELSTTWSFSIAADLPTADGGEKPLELHGTIHQLAQ